VQAPIADIIGLLNAFTLKLTVLFAATGWLLLCVNASGWIRFPFTFVASALIVAVLCTCIAVAGMLRQTKPTRTLSETWFEEFCARAGILYVRVAETESKTPDYTLTVQGQTVIAEVKEITRNKEERESDRLVRERGYGNVTGGTPGARVRKKIAESSAQIKALAQGRHPSVLVLFDFGRGHLEPYHIRVAMYGLEQIHIAVGRDPSVRPYTTGMSYGPKRKMTRTDNTSISAIGHLYLTGPDTVFLDVYHNTFAAIPLNPTLLAAHGVPQFRLADEQPGVTAQWEEVG
jgi:hypothetical protein